jgi:hypothetical protein
MLPHSSTQLEGNGDGQARDVLTSGLQSYCSCHQKGRNSDRLADAAPYLRGEHRIGAVATRTHQ